MKRILLLIAAMVLAAGAGPAWAQGTELATLRAEIAKQQVIISQLLKRIEALEKKQPPASPTAQDLQDEIKAQEDSINSLRETVNSKVNLNGYYNFSSQRTDPKSPRPSSSITSASSWGSSSGVQLPDGAGAAERAAPSRDCAGRG